jgi:AraC-like DNA-binding protein
MEDGALLRNCGVSLKQLHDPYRHFPLAVSVSLWKSAIEQTGDAAFGIKAASYIKSTTFHALSFGISASPSLKDAFQRAERYSHMISDAVRYKLTQRGKHKLYYLDIIPTASVPPESVDCLAAACIRMCRSRLGRGYSPVRVEFQRKRPAQLTDFDEILRTPLLFGASHTRIILDCDAVNRPLDDGDASLARHHDALVLQYHSELKHHNIHFRVRESLVRGLEQGEMAQATISQLLNMSKRTLQRRLHDSGHTFAHLTDEVRLEWATSALSTGYYSISEITYLLGFSNSLSFRRAFQRWTGLTPSEWCMTQARPTSL